MVDSAEIYFLLLCAKKSPNQLAEPLEAIDFRPFKTVLNRFLRYNFRKKIIADILTSGAAGLKFFNNEKKCIIGIISRVHFVDEIRGTFSAL